MKKQKVKEQKNYRPRRALRYISWTCGIISVSYETVLLGYLSYYLTDTVFMAAGMVAAILAASRIFDGISDIIAGYIVDHTKTKWGKARPYSIFCVLMWIAVFFLFSVPDLSDTGKIIYVFLLYNLTETVFRTMAETSGSVHFKNAFTGDEQLQVTGISGTIAGVLGMIVGIGLPILVDTYGTTQEGWRIIALLMAVPCAILGLMRLLFLPEVDEAAICEKNRKGPSVKESVKLLFSNKYLFFFLIAFLLTNLYQALGVSTYYFKYILGDVAAGSLVSAVGLLSMVIMPMLPMLAKKVGMNRTILIGLLMGVGSLIGYIAPSNTIVVALGQALLVMGIIPLSMYSTIILSQCMTYTLWKDGRQIDGVIGAMSGLAGKISRALGAMITGFVLSAVNYDGTLAVQNDAANGAIKFMYLAAPAIACFIAALLMSKYDLDKKMPQIEKELAERNQTNPES